MFHRVAIMFHRAAIKVTFEAGTTVRGPIVRILAGWSGDRERCMPDGERCQLPRQAVNRSADRPDA
jgi:hypothetical protein